MNCATCGHENRGTAKFCDECAAPLRSRCAHCGSEMRPTARFCDECGVPLLVAASTLVEEAAYQGERRTAHRLFTEMGAIGQAERLAEELGL